MGFPGPDEQDVKLVYDVNTGKCTVVAVDDTKLDAAAKGQLTWKGNGMGKAFHISECK